MKNRYLLLPLIGCIWILTLVTVHFYTMQSNDIQLNRFTIEQIQELTTINEKLLDGTSTTIEDNSYLLKEAIQVVKILDFELDSPLFVPIYSNLLLINELIKDSSSTPTPIYLKEQHQNFLKSYLEDIQSILLTIHLSSDPFTKALPTKALIQLLEVTTSYYEQYKN